MHPYLNVPFFRSMRMIRPVIGRELRFLKEMDDDEHILLQRNVGFDLDAVLRQIAQVAVDGVTAKAAVAFPLIDGHHKRNVERQPRFFPALGVFLNGRDGSYRFADFLADPILVNMSQRGKIGLAVTRGLPELEQAFGGFEHRRRYAQRIRQDGREAKILKHERERELNAEVAVDDFTAFQVGLFTGRTAGLNDSKERGDVDSGLGGDGHALDQSCGVDPYDGVMGKLGCRAAAVLAHVDDFSAHGEQNILMVRD